MLHSRQILWAGLIAGFVLALAARGTLPDRVASHFGFSGEADGWMSRDGFLMFFVGVQVLMAGMFLALGRWLPRIPDSMINMPNKGYWLAPERREESLAEMVRRMIGIGALTQLFFLGLFVVTWSANLSEAPALGGAFWIVFVGYLVALGWSMWRLYRRFAIPAPAS